MTRWMTRLMFISLMIGLMAWCTAPVHSQTVSDFTGQISVYGNIAPESQKSLLFGMRFIPVISQKFILNETHTFDYEASANIYGMISAFETLDASEGDAQVNPYRLWARYSGDQYELRVGLQKITFGSATILRPLMWFDRIDSRDPLKLTNGVYGALGRYYFLNNANVWVWALYGNDELRGWDIIPGSKTDPEFGGRVQSPLLEGELALTYHHRTAGAQNLMNSDTFDRISETRLGLDGKWDITVGFWFETTWIFRSENLGIYTNQSMVNLGSDYTFDLGNGLNVTIEHLISALDEHKFGFSKANHTTSSSFSYPLGMSDQISMILTHSWETNKSSFFLNYEHQFDKITGHVMVYHTPENQAAVEEETLASQLSDKLAGPGIRIMLVYHY
jgi:hypothetical protein